MSSRVSSTHGSAADHPSTHETNGKNKSRDGSGDSTGNSADMQAAVDAFAQQMMMKIFQDQQERTAEDREEDPDAA